MPWLIRMLLWDCGGYDLLQHTATHCHTLPHTATHCNTLQHTATHCKLLQHTLWDFGGYDLLQHTTTHCHTLPNTATHCHTLPHTATHCHTLQHTATHCNILQHTMWDCGGYDLLQHTATHCHRLQHTATHCNTLQHTATHTVRLRWIWLTSAVDVYMSCTSSPYLYVMYFIVGLYIHVMYLVVGLYIYICDHCYIHMWCTSSYICDMLQLRNVYMSCTSSLYTYVMYFIVGLYIHVTYFMVGPCIYVTYFNVGRYIYICDHCYIRMWCTSSYICDVPHRRAIYICDHRYIYTCDVRHCIYVMYFIDTYICIPVVIATCIYDVFRRTCMMRFIVGLCIYAIITMYTRIHVMCFIIYMWCTSSTHIYVCDVLHRRV